MSNAESSKPEQATVVSEISGTSHAEVIETYEGTFPVLEHGRRPGELGWVRLSHPWQSLKNAGVACSGLALLRVRFKIEHPSQLPLAFELQQLPIEALADRLDRAGEILFHSHQQMGRGEHLAAFGQTGEIISHRTRAEYLAWERDTFPEYPSTLDNDSQYFVRVKFPLSLKTSAAPPVPWYDLPLGRR